MERTIDIYKELLSGVDRNVREIIIWHQEESVFVPVSFEDYKKIKLIVYRHNFKSNKIYYL